MSDDGSLVARLADPGSGGLSVLDSVSGERVARRLVTGASDATWASIRFNRTGSIIWRTDQSRVMSLDLATQAWEVAVTAPEAIADVDQMADGSLLTAHDDGWVRRWRPDGTLVDSVRVTGVPLRSLAVDRSDRRGGRRGLLRKRARLAAGRAQPGSRHGHASGTGRRRRPRDPRWARRGRGLAASGSGVDGGAGIRARTLAGWGASGRQPGRRSAGHSRRRTAAKQRRRCALRSMDTGAEYASVAPPEGATHVAGMAYSDDGTRLVVTYGWESTTYWHRQLPHDRRVVDAASGTIRLAVPDDMADDRGHRRRRTSRLRSPCVPAESPAVVLERRLVRSRVSRSSGAQAPSTAVTVSRCRTT